MINGKAAVVESNLSCWWCVTEGSTQRCLTWGFFSGFVIPGNAAVLSIESFGFTAFTSICYPRLDNLSKAAVILGLVFLLLDQDLFSRGSRRSVNIFGITLYDSNVAFLHT